MSSRYPCVRITPADVVEFSQEKGQRPSIEDAERWLSRQRRCIEEMMGNIVQENLEEILGEAMIRAYPDPVFDRQYRDIDEATYGAVQRREHDLGLVPFLSPEPLLNLAPSQLVLTVGFAWKAFETNLKGNLMTNHRSLAKRPDYDAHCRELRLRHTATERELLAITPRQATQDAFLRFTKLHLIDVERAWKLATPGQRHRVQNLLFQDGSSALRKSDPLVLGRSYPGQEQDFVG